MVVLLGTIVLHGTCNEREWHVYGRLTNSQEPLQLLFPPLTR